MVNENFFDDLIFYDKDQIDEQLFRILEEKVRSESFDPEIIGRCSKAASTLASWILSIYHYSKVARSQKTKFEQVQSYQELYNKVRFVYR